MLVMDFNGRPIAREDDFPFKEKLFGLMGVGVSAKGDADAFAAAAWIALASLSLACRQETGYAQKT